MRPLPVCPQEGSPEPVGAGTQGRPRPPQRGHSPRPALLNATSVEAQGHERWQLPLLPLFCAFISGGLTPRAAPSAPSLAACGFRGASCHTHPAVSLGLVPSEASVRAPLLLRGAGPDSRASAPPASSPGATSGPRPAFPQVSPRGCPPATAGGHDRSLALTSRGRDPERCAPQNQEQHGRLPHLPCRLVLFVAGSSFRAGPAGRAEQPQAQPAERELGVRECGGRKLGVPELPGPPQHRAQTSQLATWAPSQHLSFPTRAGSGWASGGPGPGRTRTALGLCLASAKTMISGQV